MRFERRYPHDQRGPFRQVYRWQGWLTRQGREIASFDQGMEERRVDGRAAPQGAGLE